MKRQQNHDALIDELLAHLHASGPGFDHPRVGRTPCNIYSGRLSRKGYAIFRGKPAHRLVWEWFNRRAIPAGMVVHHKCRTRPCCSPLHLELTTLEKNSSMNSWSARTSCIRGHPFRGDNFKIRNRVRSQARADGSQRTVVERICLRCHQIRKKKSRRLAAIKRIFARAAQQLRRLNIDDRQVLDAMAPLIASEQNERISAGELP